MLLNLRLKLKTPILGCQKVAKMAERGETITDDVMRFRKTHDARGILFPGGFWFWSIKEAAKSLGEDVMLAERLSFPDHFDAPSLNLFNRKYSVPAGGKPEQRSQLHESVPAGAEIGFTCAVQEFNQNGEALELVDAEDLIPLFLYIGKFLGISPFGSKFGYGRFNVKELKKIEAADLLKLERDSADRGSILRPSRRGADIQP